MLVLVTNQKRNTYKYRRKLLKLGMTYENGKWRLQTSDDSHIEEILRFCKRKFLHIECIEDKYVRSTDYRKNFLQNYEKKDGRYLRCAYCGRKLTVANMTVDHIIPIDKVQHKQKYRALMRLLGIKNINDIKNLTPACEKCNKKKGRKLKGFYLNGITGRTYKGVIIRRTIKFFVTLIVLGTFLFLAWQIVFNKQFSIYSFLEKITPKK